jgi:hypothetical protein
MELFSDNSDWDRDEPSPEVEFFCRDIQIEAARSASRLADTWHLRPTADLRDAAVELSALASVVSLELLHVDVPCEKDDAGQALPENIRALVVLSFSRIRNTLPFSEREKIVLRKVMQCWDEEGGEWRRSLSSEESDLTARWHGFLRDSEPGTARLPVSASALVMHQTCVELFHELTDFIGRPGPLT